MLGHGQWIPYLENELGYSQTTAKDFMRVATEFGDPNRRTFGDLPGSKVFALPSLRQENRDDFLQSSNVEDHTVRQLKEEIAKYKEENTKFKY